MPVSRALSLGFLALTLGACGGRSSSQASHEACAGDCRPPPDARHSLRMTRLPAGPRFRAMQATGAPQSIGPVRARRRWIGDSPLRAWRERRASPGLTALLAAAPAAGGARFATGVVDHAFGRRPEFQPSSGLSRRTTRTARCRRSELGRLPRNGGWLVLEFAGNAIVDGPGVDFTVFENPLANFRELGTVAVSDDRRTWVEFPCTAGQDESNFGDCAGVGVVLSSPTNGIDPLDPKVSGGDHYDLSEISRRSRALRAHHRPRGFDGPSGCVRISTR